MSDQEDESQFPEKWMKIIKSLPEFQDEADAASSDGLKKIIVDSSGRVSFIEKEMSNDVKLNAAKEMVSEYSASYKEAIKAQTAKIKYAVYLLEGRGETLDSKE